MLLEFTGPAGIGKTTLSKLLASQNNNFKRANNPKNLITIWSLLWLIKYLPQCGKQIRHSIEYAKKRNLRHPILSGILLTLKKTQFLGMKKSKEIYVRDEAAFQCSKWIAKQPRTPQTTVEDIIIKGDTPPDLLILLDGPTQLIEKQLKLRGDYTDRLISSKNLGFSSISERKNHYDQLRFQKEQICEKNNIAITKVTLSDLGKVKNIESFKNRSKVSLTEIITIEFAIRMAIESSNQ